jgi:PPM family protein phosphatase
MGGHAAGEVAYQLTVETICDHLSELSEPPASPVDLPPSAAVDALVEAVRHANATVFRAAQLVPELHGMGTTLVAALAFHGGFVVAHVGDSRAYLLRGRWLARLTEDHTVGTLRRTLGPDPFHFTRFVGNDRALTRSVGSDGRIDVETRTISPCRGDVLLLCSDGLTNVVDDQEIQGILTGHDDLEGLAEQLIARANAKGGPDNVTVTLQRWN